MAPSDPHCMKHTIRDAKCVFNTIGKYSTCACACVHPCMHKYTCAIYIYVHLIEKEGGRAGAREKEGEGGRKRDRERGRECVREREKDGVREKKREGGKERYLRMSSYFVLDFHLSWLLKLEENVYSFEWHPPTHSLHTTSSRERSL